MHRTPRIVIYLMLLVGVELVAGSVPAEDFKITRIVDIGPVSDSVSLGSFNFSPAGDKLGCFAGSSLIVSDTLGSTREIKRLTMQLRGYEWLSNDEILVHELQRFEPDTVYQRVSRLDVNTGAMETVYENWRYAKRVTSDSLTLKGFIRTIEGHTGYVLMNWWRELLYRFPESKYDKTAQTKAMTEDRILLWGDSGLYKVSTNLLDSIRLGPKFTYTKYTLPVYDRGFNYVMDGATIMRLADSSFIVLDTMLGVPEGCFGCSAFAYRLNPVFPEVFFDWSCYRRDSTGADKYLDRPLLVEFESGRFESISKSVGMDSCSYPVFAPDGKKLALSAAGKGYIIYREWNDGAGKK